MIAKMRSKVKRSGSQIFQVIQNKQDNQDKSWLFFMCVIFR
jgi:hypothetical protein